MGMFEKAVRESFKGDKDLLRAGLALCVLISECAVAARAQVGLPCLMKRSS